MPFHAFKSLYTVSIGFNLSLKLWEADITLVVRINCNSVYLASLSSNYLFRSAVARPL